MGGGDVKVVPFGKECLDHVHVHYGCSVTYLHKLGGLYECLCGLTCRGILNILQNKPVTRYRGLFMLNETHFKPQTLVSNWFKSFPLSLNA